jgi:hypothetical protein
MARLSMKLSILLMILFGLSCTHPITGQKTDPLTAFWYSLDAPDSSLRAMAEYSRGSYYHHYHYHHYHHYNKVIGHRAKPKIYSASEIDKE